jgi:putative PIN family toxin of toxin-antitoxin system
VRKVVIDTNVLVSHLFGGKPRDVIMLWFGGQIELCISDEIIGEYSRVLGRFGDARNDASGLLSSVTTETNVRMVVPGERFRAVPADPSDNIFLECAVAAGADAIVSGDRHLLGLGEFRGIRIVDPAGFLALQAAR